jgi:hypothetical protein
LSVALLGRLASHPHGVLTLLRRHAIEHLPGLATQRLALLGHSLRLLAGLLHAAELFSHPLHR